MMSIVDDEREGTVDAPAGIDPARLQAALDVIAEVDRLPSDHPDTVALQRATSGLFKRVRKARKSERLGAIRAADKAVIARTATAAPGRIDDETLGIPLVSQTAGSTAGTLLVPRPCYVCKQDYTQVDAFYHQLCPTCALKHHERRHVNVDLRGKRALLTGGRAKIGMYIALRLLRDGAHTTITTRFPQDAARRFASMEDSSEWLHRLRIVGIDLRDPHQVIALADSVTAQGPLDILINNAAQTVRRSADAYSLLSAAESRPLEAGEAEVDMLVLGQPRTEHPASLPSTLTASDVDARAGGDGIPVDVTALAMTARSAAMGQGWDGGANLPGISIDAGGLVPDEVTINSWTQVVHEVDPVELLEVTLCNMTAPFLLVSRLRPALAASAARRKYIVNVSAMEGQFGRGYKGPGHPHTNMAKAALNMLTRTSAREMLETDRILMTSVDTGWITDERPHTTKVRLADEGFHAPLDLVDGAARVYDPIVRGEAGEDLFGIFLKDYVRCEW